MKLLISDYDGTLKTDVENLKINLELIREFKKEGNLFCIATGRSYLSIKREICKYDIPYDYLICNNGAAIFNQSDKLLYVKYIPKELVEKIKAIIMSYDYKFDIFNEFGQETNDNIVSMCVDTKSLFGNHKMAQEIKDIFDDISFYKQLNYLYLKAKTNKAIGINNLIDLDNLDICKDDIITVGDAINDLEMLKEYNGYKVLSSYPCLYFKGIKTCREVHTLVKKLR